MPLFAQKSEVSLVFRCFSEMNGLIRKSERARWIRSYTPLTLSPEEQAIWLPVSVHTPLSNVQGVLPEYGARLSNVSKLMPKLSAFTSKTKQHSPLMSIQSASFTQSYQTGELETCGASKSGQQSEVNRPCFHGRSSHPN